jgi:hypothetical protein
MTHQAKLIILKLLHSVIWIVFNVIIFYLLWAAITNHLDIFFWIGCALVGLEGIVLLLYQNHCPLTILARRYSASTQDNFDIFLPNWLARHTKLIYTSIMVAVLAFTIFQLIRKR